MTSCEVFNDIQQRLSFKPFLSFFFYLLHRLTKNENLTEFEHHFLAYSSRIEPFPGVLQAAFVCNFYQQHRDLLNTKRHLAAETD